MRLDKLTLGSAKAPVGGVDRHRFKNLKNVTIDFDQDHWVTVVIGWNGAGKSNVLEALAIIFRDLIAKERRPAFAFQIDYRMGVGDSLRHIRIDADPDREKKAYQIYVATDDEARGRNLPQPLPDGAPTVTALRGSEIKFTAFVADESPYLPRYVFSYYSGESPRMREIFMPYQEKFDSKLRRGVDPGLKRLFFALPVHSQFVLLAFLIHQPEFVRDFLREHLLIDPDEGLESVLFVLRQPPWNINSPDGDPRFWGARGVVSKFLSRLQDAALAPITVARTVPTSLWNEKTLEFKYLYIKDISALQKLVGEHDSATFFRDLESTYVSQLIDKVLIRVRLKNNDGSVTFSELSEGEQQLLTVLGLLRFTAEDESLFLLDEPDTHLNPRWCVDYIDYLKKFVAGNLRHEQTSHILLTTHNPLAIAELKKEQIQILSRDMEDGTATAKTPTFNPRGMGFAGLLTSDLFKLSSSLDRATYKALEAEAILAQKENLSEEERVILSDAQELLKGAEFRHAFMDPLQEEYSRARSELINQASPLAQGLSDYPGSSMRRRVARKILLKTLGISLPSGKGGEE